MFFRKVTLPVPELALIAFTRAMAGAGLGLLLADRLKPNQKRAIGWSLFAVGILSTFPLAADVLCRHKQSEPGDKSPNNGASLPDPELASSRA
jgi:hypothetical protein